MIINEDVCYGYKCKWVKSNRDVYCVYVCNDLNGLQKPEMVTALIYATEQAVINKLSWWLNMQLAKWSYTENATVLICAGG